MCLLIHQPKGLTFSKHELRDFLSYNEDGFGIMYGDGRRLRVHKALGTPDELIKMYYRHGAGREAILHFRMKTHGPVSHENVHPFLVTPSIGMAHNGILGIGNPFDTKKTDTWHLIEYFIRPIARRNPDLLFNPIWCEMLGDLIGSGNKLAFCHADGRTSLVNESHGVKHKGAWMSNTYAWSAPKSLKSQGYGYGGYSRHSLWGDEDIEFPKSGSSGTSTSTTHVESRSSADTSEPATEVAEWFDQVCAAYRTSGTTGILQWVDKYPARAEGLIHDFYEYTKEEVHALVEDYPQAAVETLEGIIHAMMDTNTDGPSEDDDDINNAAE